MDQLTDKLNPLTEQLPPEAQGLLAGWKMYLVLAIVALVVLWILWAVLTQVIGGMLRGLFGGRKPPDRDRGLQEDLAHYPPAPGRPGRRRLLVEGEPARVRLVVVAPVGQKPLPPASEIELLLDLVIRGLGDVIARDKPRVRLWPPRLSVAGFAPEFHRMTRSPDKPGTPSHWTLVAGQARAGAAPVLVGLALWTDEATLLGKLTLEPGQWAETLRLQTVED